MLSTDDLFLSNALTASLHLMSEQKESDEDLYEGFNNNSFGLQSVGAPLLEPFHMREECAITALRRFSQCVGVFVLHRSNR